MMPSDPDQFDSARQPVQNSPLSDASDANAQSSAALRHVLQQILSVTETDKGDGGGEVRRELVQLARTHSKLPFSLDPVLKSMVGVMIDRIQPLSADQRATIQESVARTLYDDVASRIRIESLWKNLKRLASDGE
jgi:hypothetical protein